MHAMWCAVVIGILTLTGCQATTQPEPDIPLPGFADEGPARPTGVYAVIRRVDVPLDQSTDEAWSIVNEQVVPPVTRGTWRGNGLRIGLLQRDKLDAYSEVMPQPVAFSRSLINRSDYPVSIIATPKLRSDLRFEMDLTRPPRPRFIEKVNGGDNSTLRLLAQIVTEEDGRHTLVLTPQHHIPSPLDLIPRDPLDKEMDGRVYDELALRVTMRRDQVAVVGLHWPWPMGEVIEDDEPGDATTPDRVSLRTSTDVIAANPNDPAAPPPHLRDDAPAEVAPKDGTPDESVEQDPAPRFERVPPPLATSYGSTLLTGTVIRQPVRTVLLITIEQPDQDLPELPEE